MIAVALITMLLSFSFAMTALGNSLLQEVKGFLSKEMKLVLNGGPWTMDINGETFYPLIYNDRTYLPVRAVAEALDVPIAYEAESKTVYIGERTVKVPILSEEYSPISAQIVNDAQQRLINQEDHGTVALFSKVIYSNSRMLLAPKAKYTTLVLYVDVDGDDVNLTINNLNEANRPVSIHSELISESNGLKEIEVDIRGIQTLNVELITSKANHNAVVRIAADQSYFK